MAATARVLDFRPRYEGEELDRLARQVAEVLAPVFDANGWRWDGEIPSVVDLAFAVRRLLATAAEGEPGRAAITDPIWVNRNSDDELRVYLELGVVGPRVDDTWT
jgi:hypothetical protein